ncbi:ribonuclease HII [Candidatus Woesearchaeota archaeon]|nr:ribonuclease HII [Candidatus Woesearchaeota archaeon]
MIIAGIDEAGRGPVIGPIVMAIAVIDEKDLPELEKIGVKDSKLITPANRERMIGQIKRICKYEIIAVGPADIDSAVESETTNLNWLEADVGAKLINNQQKNGVEKVFVDCPSANPKAYTDYLRQKLSYKPKLVVEHKADYKYLIVGAASILAKVTRDHAIEELKKKHNVNFGSGYPADPVTAQFVKDKYDKYDFFRKSWGTWKTAAKKAESKQKTLSGF